jgi:hypothetical protein
MNCTWSKCAAVGSPPRQKSPRILWFKRSPVLDERADGMAGSLKAIDNRRVPTYT